MNSRYKIKKILMPMLLSSVLLSAQGEWVLDQAGLHDGEHFPTALECQDIETIRILESVSEVGLRDIAYIFSDCHSLSSVSIPNVRGCIGHHVLFGEETLIGIELPRSVTMLNGKPFEDKEIREFSIPEGITVIDDNAFGGCSSLKKITIGSVKSMGNGAFLGCSSLEFVFILGSVERIGDYAFYDCHALDGVVFLGESSYLSLKSIGAGCFSGCNSLFWINVPRGVTNLGRDAFNGCQSLRSIRVSENLLDKFDLPNDNCSVMTYEAEEREMQRMEEERMMNDPTNPASPMYDPLMNDPTNPNSPMYDPTMNDPMNPNSPMYDPTMNDPMMP